MPGRLCWRVSESLQQASDTGGVDHVHGDVLCLISRVAERVLSNLHGYAFLFSPCVSRLRRVIRHQVYFRDPHCVRTSTS